VFNNTKTKTPKKHSTCSTSESHCAPPLPPPQSTAGYMAVPGPASPQTPGGGGYAAMAMQPMPAGGMYGGPGSGGGGGAAGGMPPQQMVAAQWVPGYMQQVRQGRGGVVRALASSCFRLSLLV
jgi:hypothetical protein